MKIKLSKFLLLILSFIFIITPVYADGDDPTGDEPESPPEEVIELTKVTILYERDYIVLEENNQMQLEVDLQPLNANTDNLRWYSNDENVATIDENGLITAHNYGETIIGITNGSVSNTFILKVISEPEKTLNNFVQKLSTINPGGYYSKKLANNSQFVDDLINVAVSARITDPRITFTYAYSYTYSDSAYYNLTFNIENVGGSTYSKTKSQGLYIRIAENIDEDLKIPLNDELYVTFNNVLKYDLGNTLNDSFKRITNKDTIIFNVENISNEYKEKYRLDLLNGYKDGYNMYYYERKTITIENVNEIIVPYNIRTEFALKNMLKYDWGYYGTITYDEELTNGYNYKQDNMGIYRFSTSYGTNMPVIIYREERPLTNIEINAPTTRIPLDVYNYELTISSEFLPTDATYEIINWKNSNPDVISLDNNGVIKPLSLGKTTISACNTDETVCDEIEIEVVPNSEIYLIDSKEYLYLFNDGLLYYLSDRNLKLLNSNVKNIQNSYYYITNDDELYYVAYNITKENITNIYTHNKVSENIKYFYGSVIINTSDELYEYDSNNSIIGNKLLDNVKEYNNGLILTNDNKLYVYGNNCYSKTLNGGEYINTPMLLIDGVSEISKDGNQGFYLNTDGSLHVFNNNLLEPQLFDTNVTTIVSTESNTDGIGENGYMYKKGNTFVYGTYRVSNNKVINSKIENNDAKKVEYNKVTGQIDKNKYNIIDNNNKFCTKYNCLENVKDFAILKDGSGDTLYLITNDNKLYYISTNMYDTFYYLSDNIDSFMFNSIIKTSNNNYWKPYNYGVLPEQLSRSSSPYIPSYSVLLDRTEKTDITIEDELDIYAIILPVNTTDKTIEWSVSDETLATIDSNGKLTALKSGVVAVYATTVDGIVGSLDITIHGKPNQVFISNKDHDHYIVVDYDYYNGNHNYVDIYAYVGPEDAIARKIVWSCNKPELVTLDSLGEGDYYSIVRVYDNGVYVNDYVTIYAMLPDGSAYDTIDVRLIKKHEYIDYENPTINLHYDNIYQIEIASISPEDFNTSYISYFPVNNGDYFDMNDYLHIRDVGTHTVNVYVFGKFYREFYIYAIDEEVSNSYLKEIRINDCHIDGYINSNFHSTIYEYDLGETYDETINIEGIAFDNNSVVTGDGNINLLYGNQTILITVYNENISSTSEYYLKIRRLPSPSIANVSNLTEALNNTDSDMVILNLYDDDSNIINKDDIEIAKERNLKLRINKFDRDLLLYSWNIDMSKFSNNTDFDSFVTINMYDSNINGISIDGIGFNCNYKGVLPENTKLKVYTADILGENALYLYEFKDNESIYINLYGYNNGVEFNIDDTNKRLYLVTPDFTKGDLNLNNRIDLTDIITLLKLYLGSITSDNLSIAIGDIDYNGRITLYDIIILLKWYLYDN